MNRSVVLFAAGVLLCGCATLGRAVFNSKLSDCEASFETCNARCSSGTGDADLCDARYVIVAERGVTDGYGVVSLDTNLERLCTRGINRACEARNTIRGAVEREKAAQRDKQVAANAEPDEKSRSTTFKAAVKDTTKQAREALAIIERAAPKFDRGPARYAIMHADGASRCFKPCNLELAAAKRELARAQEIVAAIQAEKDAAQVAAEAEKRVRDEFEEAVARCGKDPKACRAECASSTTSMLCVAMAIRFSVGDADFAPQGPHPRHARELAKATCDAGNTAGCKFVEQLDATASKCTSERDCALYCGAGFSEACGNLGEMYASGNDVRKDSAMAATFFKKACDLGLPGGCNALGGAYFDGKGVPRDVAAAQRYFRAACDGFQNRVDERIGQGKSVDILVTQKTTACSNEFGTSCVIRVKSSERRRPDLDQQCKRQGLPGNAWGTLNGTDTDECLNAMMNRGCTELMGSKAYCCP